eukprot:1158666-Pelagomonas_calceolata.AAC.4
MENNKLLSTTTACQGATNFRHMYSAKFLLAKRDGEEGSWPNVQVPQSPVFMPGFAQMLTFTMPVSLKRAYLKGIVLLQLQLTYLPIAKSQCPHMAPAWPQEVRESGSRLCAATSGCEALCEHSLGAKRRGSHDCWTRQLIMPFPVLDTLHLALFRSNPAVKYCLTQSQQVGCGPHPGNTQAALSRASAAWPTTRLPGYA